MLHQKKESKETYVRKISSKKDYNNRLYAQMLKQLNFTSNNNKIRTPKIIESGYIEECFYFDMEYVQGKLLSECLNDLDYITLSPYVNITVDYLLENKNIDLCFEDTCQKIKNKTNALIGTIDKKYTKYINLIEKTDWSLTPLTKCHGDFTLENLIVSNNNLYLIDFLDSFIESPLADIAKILFDLRYFWSNRRLRADNNSIIKNMYMESMITSSEVYVRHNRKINSLLILSILRILPYTKNRKTISYLEECLSHAAKH